MLTSRAKVIREVTHLVGDDRDTHLHVMCRHPEIPHAFREILIEQVSGDDPGIQLADRILWQERRGRMDSLGMSMTREIAPSRPFTIRRYSRGGVALAPVPHRAFGRDVRTIPLEERLFSLREIERAVHCIARTRPPATRHLEGTVIAASRRTLGNTGLELGDISKLCRAFLLIVDTLPLYQDPEVAGQLPAEAVGLAAAMITARETWVVTLADFWIERRAALIAAGQGNFLSRDER